MGVRLGTGGEYTAPFMATEMARYQFLASCAASVSATAVESS